MKFLILFALLGLALAETYDEFKALNNGKSVTKYAAESGFATFEFEFYKFKTENNKQYDSAEEEKKRKFNFLNTLKFIQKHNELYKRGESTYEVGVTLFADMTSEEYLKTFTMPNPNKQNITSKHYIDEPVSQALPASYDWRLKNKVTPIKNQGQCGSCWAFASVAAVESQLGIKHNQMHVLSEQQLIDCLNSKCQGNSIDAGLEYIKTHGVEKTADYPHIATYGACHSVASKYHAHITGYTAHCKAVGKPPCPDVDIMNAVLTHGPVAVGLDAFGDDFMHYKKGILTTGQAEWKAAHAVTIVGWGPNYWIIKNSWGTTWGESGYLRLARNKDLRGVNQFVYVVTS